MKNEVEENTQQQIVKIVRTRGRTNLSDLARILKKSPSTIKYHLDILSGRGIVVADQTKFYMVAQEGDIEESILEAIVKYGRQKRSDFLGFEELIAFGQQLNEAFQNLVTKGLLVEREDGIVELTRWGTNKRGVCHVCYKPVAGLSTVSFVTDILFEHGGQRVMGDVPEVLTAILIHPKCFRKLANEMIGEYSEIQIPDDCFCDYCGLPLSIGIYKMLVENIGASIEEIRSDLSKCEREIIDSTQKTWRTYLTSREDVEELAIEIEEEAKKNQIDYNREMREQRLWLATECVINGKQERINEIIRTLYGPIEIAYSKIVNPWGSPTERDIITTDKESFKYAPHEASFGMVFVGEKGERLHPLCARVLKSEMGATQTPQGESILGKKASPYGGVGK